MKHFKSVILAATASTALISSTVSLAEDSLQVTYNPVEAKKITHRQESTGVLTGLVIGGLTAGPGGAIIGAISGGLLGNNLGNEQEKSQLQASLNQTETAYLQLANEKRELEAQYQLAMAELQNNRLQPASLSGKQSSIVGDTALAIHFRTNSTTIESHYQEQLARFARLVNSRPDSVVRITGYADARGDNDSNLVLSQQRVANIERLLQSLGLDTRVQTIAYGESRPLTDSETLESYFYDRRVEITLHSGSGDLITNAGN